MSGDVQAIFDEAPGGLGSLTILKKESEEICERCCLKRPLLTGWREQGRVVICRNLDGIWKERDKAASRGFTLSVGEW